MIENLYDVPSVDLADFGDHTGITKLIDESGLSIEDQEYWNSFEPLEVPAMTRLA